jgi:enediyne biosynthesis protein E4
MNLLYSFLAVVGWWFLEITPFPATLENDAHGERHQVETMTGGVAVLDFDNDGREDLFFVNGASPDTWRKAGPHHWNRLYRNMGEFRFEDVTARAGLQGDGYDMAAAVGDYNGDGWPDLFVAGVKSSALYRNTGKGSFVKAPLPANTEWSVGGGFYDYDRDGDEDLFVVRYVQYDAKSEPWCGDAKRKIRTYCHPDAYAPVANQLYRNDSGVFVDVSAAAGIAQHKGKGMGVAFADYDRDGWVDIAVTNDALPDFLFRNQGDGSFVERGMEAGVGRNDDGRALSSMGVEFRDLNDDGRPDLFITALANESFPFYRNDGGGFFSDVTYATLIGKATLALSGWGVGAFDFDNDGRKDLFTANGDVNSNTEQFSSRASRQACVMLRQQPDGRFAAETVSDPALHRGAAFADFNNDGRMDVVVSRLQERPLLLRNARPTGNWLRLDLPGASNGSEVVVTAGGRVQHHLLSSAGSYASSSSRIVHVGLGRATVAESVEVRYATGEKRVWQQLAVNKTHQLRR